MPKGIYQRATLKERFLSKIKKIETGCWLWNGYVSKNGYGQISRNRKHKWVHRIAYELFKTRIPSGLTIDHLCKIKRCVNPEHLEAVDARTNTLRGNNPCARNAKKIYCHRGHSLLDKDNTYYYLNHRRCRRCIAEDSKIAYRKRKYLLRAKKSWTEFEIE